MKDPRFEAKRLPGHVDLRGLSIYLSSRANDMLVYLSCMVILPVRDPLWSEARLQVSAMDADIHFVSGVCRMTPSWNGV